MENNQFYSQAGQDKFIRNVLKEKRNGYFVEIGSQDPININNTYGLETHLSWSGLMIEIDSKWLESYERERPNSIHIIDDATQIDYLELLRNNNAPKDCDYLQIDIEAIDGSTLKALERFEEVMGEYRFATVTFEHDVYRKTQKKEYEKICLDTHRISREIFERNGYVRVFSDVNSFEDWYVHPDLVDMDHVNDIIEKNVGKTAHRTFEY